MLAETKQHSLGTPCSSWLCRCRLYKAKGGSQRITFPFPHSCVCVCVHICIFWIGWGRSHSSVREFPPSTHQSDDIISYTCILLFPCWKWGFWDKSEGWVEREQHGQDFLSGTNPVPLRKQMFLFKNDGRQGSHKKSSSSNYLNLFWHWDTSTYCCLSRFFKKEDHKKCDLNNRKQQKIEPWEIMKLVACW